jgi:O-antigen/teichoic acid export membrane protein
VVLYFLYLAEFGLQTLGTRTIAQDRGEMHRYVGQITVLRIVLAVICFVLLLIFVALLPGSEETKQLLIVFGFAFLPSALLLEWVFQGIEQMEYVALGRVLKGMVFAGLVFFFVNTPEHLYHAAAFYVAGIAAASAILLWFYVRKFGLPSWKVNITPLMNTLREAAPLAAGSFISQVNYNFGTVALGLLLTDVDVGLFSAAYKIVLFLWAFAALAAANAVFPLMAKSYKQSVALFSDSLKNLLRIFVFAAIPVGIGGSILASQIMGFLYTPEYQKAVIVFQLSIWTVVIVIYRMVFENALVAGKSQRRYFVGYVLAGLITIVGNLLLIPVLGFVAPSIVGIVSESTLLLYFIASCKFVRPSYVLKVTVKPLAAGSLMGLALWLLPLNLFVLLAIGIVLYFAFLIAVRALTLEEVTTYVHSLVH